MEDFFQTLIGLCIALVVAIVAAAVAVRASRRGRLQNNTREDL
jgi:uncharacterized membrane protein YqjE